MEGRASSSSKVECLVCKETNHLAIDCPWRNFPCVDGCSNTMKVLVSKTNKNYDRKFLRCKGQWTQGCNAFKWLDEVDVGFGVAKAENVKDVNKDKDNLKLYINGKMPMSVEGSVDNICKLVKKLTM
ncbi:hypothetical protein FRX31_003283 [Thalictrum thalictroides]|uniref:GRF-type domain-containing protein n=1 Tax=Thalictrum thalictroides TaxID=46969 RepID=A0A7J6XBW3_THATH|nr:hypothetical protein FRX31_003283 [Thalictrum thalictroides]